MLVYEGEKMGISVVLLAYKEAENLKVLLPEIKKYVERCKEDYEILNEEYAQYDLSFKIIVIGNSGKEIFLLIQKIKR